MPVNPDLNIRENIFGAKIPAAHSIGDYIDGQLSGTTSSLQFPSDRPKYYTQLAFSTYSFRTGTGGTFAGTTIETMLRGEVKVAKWFNSDLANKWAEITKTGADTMSGISTPTADIVLPLPVNLVDVHKVKYDEKPIIPWVSALAEFAGLGTDPIRALGGLVGLAPNYYYTILFDRPEYKRHEITFKLAPRNFEEARMIRDIIVILNNRMSPGTAGLGGGAQAFTFPDIVQVTLRPNAGFLFKFKPSVVESIAFNYAGSGGKKAFYHDAAGGAGNNPPESVEFTMHLLEIEYWLKDQFNILNGP